MNAALLILRIARQRLDSVSSAHIEQFTGVESAFSYSSHHDERVSDAIPEVAAWTRAVASCVLC